VLLSHVHGYSVRDRSVRDASMYLLFQILCVNAQEREVIEV